MKKIFLVFALMLCNLFSSDAQTWTQTTSVKTPCGATVSDTWVVTGNTGFSVAEIAYWKNEVANFGATYLQDPTWTYNCHGYAWHMKPNNASAVWIGRSLSTAHNIYWHSTNGGYVEVAESSATHVDYDSPPKDPLNPGNHSAIRESQYLYVSKWGQGPLVRHAPYATLPQFKPLEQKKFYARTSYTVTFNMNGAPGSITSQSVPKCGTATKPSPDPGWSGYNFRWLV